MARPSLTLAALATAAVPGLEVTAVRSHSRSGSGEMDSAVFDTTDGRRLIIRVPRSQSAESEQSADLVALRALTPGVRARFTFAVPTFIGQAPYANTRAIVSDFLPGDVYSADELTGDEAIAAEVGRAIAMIHLLPTSFIGDSGLPSATASEARTHVAGVITRAADTGKLPAALLRRWEAAVDDIALWQFQSTVINGSLTADSFLIEGDRVSGIVGWSELQVGDPARDMHWLFSARGAATETAFTEYAAARGIGLDDALARRGLLYGELELARWLLHGVDSHDESVIEDAVSLLDQLVDRVHARSTSPLSADTGPIMALSDVEHMLDRTPREQARRDPGATLLTDTYDQSDFERGAEGELLRGDAETGVIPLDLTGFGDAHSTSGEPQAADAASTPDAGDDDSSITEAQSSRNSASS